MKSLEELKAIRDRVKSSVDIREDNSNKIRVVVGMATAASQQAHVRCWPPLPKKSLNAACIMLP